MNLTQQRPPHTQLPLENSHEDAVRVDATNRQIHVDTNFSREWNSSTVLLALRKAARHRHAKTESSRAPLCGFFHTI